ncbi:hypothetical protein DSCO28_14350 [Desulfosarcina ovata subsp. sediminis]|uniref:Antitoxin Xre/MbcA/ParS-like toxin-binding domain-containing protein n=1 Tax=Desulfosarcina ovata subsp. sediminis TaxID=885957 RepID=A0A5K7ZMM4_9BACT|nr:MbcA/ParS/Xre antitoxin family protein [Desulfosarcina ovata]BBO80869.1 hypothetical protein DSCO28_14350 [Desulfosarcina ovata subsp. sediminis]
MPNANTTKDISIKGKKPPKKGRIRVPGTDARKENGLGRTSIDFNTGQKTIRYPTPTGITPNPMGNFFADNTEERQKLATLVTRLFSRWELSTADQLELLGLSPTSRAMLGKYRKGEALPSTRDILDRVGWLMAIHKSLRILYPQNPEICYSWVKRRNQLLGNLTPLEMMKEQGIIGLYRVTRFLDYLREH